MRKTITLFLFILFSSLGIAQDGEVIWKDFIQNLKQGEITVERIKPIKAFDDSFKPILLSFLDSLRVQASETDWNRNPEIIHQDDKILYITPWSTRQDTVNYCITLQIVDSTWYFHHLEAIFIRLDKYGDLPTSTFPDINERTKDQMRQEIYWSYIIMNFYVPLSKEHGPQYALNLLKDGGGYNVSANTWVPFLPDHMAFILYLCWEQSVLRGNHVTLVNLTDTEATVKIESRFMALYKHTAHMRQCVTKDEYIAIFETIWLDRTKYSGWEVEINYLDDYNVEFQFSR